MIRLALLCALLSGCAAAAPLAPVEPRQVRRECPPVPELRARASAQERRAHTQTIVRMYAGCAGGVHDR